MPDTFANPRPYERLIERDQRAVRDAFTAATVALREAGFGCAMDDRAEHLIDALAHYTFQSNPRMRVAEIAWPAK